MYTIAGIENIVFKKKKKIKFLSTKAAALLLLYQCILPY